MPKQSPNKTAPGVLALIPDGIENFVPHCIVCTQPVSLKRARGRSKDTCSPECHAVRQMYRKWVMQTSKCLACLHPSTPQERQEFRDWRRFRGDLRRTKGRPKKIVHPENANGEDEPIMNVKSEPIRAHDAKNHVC